MVSLVMVRPKANPNPKHHVTPTLTKNAKVVTPQTVVALQRPHTAPRAPKPYHTPRDLFPRILSSPFFPSVRATLLPCPSNGPNGVPSKTTLIFLFPQNVMISYFLPFLVPSLANGSPCAADPNPCPHRSPVNGQTLLRQPPGPNPLREPAAPPPAPAQGFHSVGQGPEQASF